MATVIQQQLKKCKTCKSKTIHARNGKKMGLFGFLIHATLTIITAGIWLIPLIIWMVLTAQIGGWKCQQH